MGLFSSKYETHVATSVSRVIEDKVLPHSIKTGVMKSIVEKDDQFLENAMEELTTCVGIKANMMYTYGKDHYMNGLPTASYHSSISGQDLIQDTIEEEVGGAVTMDYYHFGMLNNLHVGWIKLMANYAYNPVTNMLTVGGQPRYLQDMQVVVKEASLAELEHGALDQWGVAATSGATPNRLAFPDLAPQTPWKTDATAPNDYLHVTYTWKDAAGLMQTGTFDMQITEYDPVASYHHAKYKKADGSIGYWLYRHNSGLHTAVDKLNTPEWETGGTYFPWAYFRYNKVSMSADKNLQEYKQAKKITKYLGMDFDSVTDAINENPDIGQVENAFLMMAVPANTENQMEMRYLFDYFDGIYALSGGSLGPTKRIQGIMGKIVMSLDSSLGDQAILIQDKKFKMAMGFRRIVKTKVAGIIGTGKIGFHTTGHGEENFTDKGADGKEFTSKVKYHFYRRQVSDSTYIEIRVLNMKMKYWVYGDYAAAATGDDPSLVIPLDKSITENYSVPKREELYARSLHYVFNSRVVQEIKWYQQSWFRGLMIIVAVVLTILSWGKTWQLIVAAMAIGATVTAIAMIVVMQILRQLLMAYIIKLFVKVVGVKWAFIVALVAVIAGGFDAASSGGLENAPWANELLALGNGLTKEIGKVQQDDFNALKHEADEYNKYIKTQKEKLEAAQEELGYNNYLAPTVVFGESPAEFYDRTVHSGNIGIVSIDAITSYVDVALTLPDFNKTLGENEYAYSNMG